MNVDVKSITFDRQIRFPSVRQKASARAIHVSCQCHKPITVKSVTALLSARCTEVRARDSGRTAVVHITSICIKSCPRRELGIQYFKSEQILTGHTSSSPERILWY